MKRGLVRVAVFLAVLTAIGVLFVRSVRQTRAEPYEVPVAHLQKWEFAIDPGNAPDSVLVAMRPARELAAALFRQLFSRHAESFNGPVQPGVPLVLQDEFNRSFAGTMTPGELLELARRAGLESTPPTPRCMAYRRESAPGVTRQLYFVVFDSPAYTRFRQEAAARAVAGSGFDPAAMSPVMFVAASDEHFNQWLPLRVSETDCVAEVVTR